MAFLKPSSISDFYLEQHILITGATGFMGKVLIEKLLRTCPKLSVLYLLVRPKKGKPPHERLKEIIDCPAFAQLRSQPNSEKLFQKLYCITGDVTKINLDLSNDDQKTIEDNVTMVFHMAANVRFDQPLKEAILLNTGGTKNLLDLACTFKKLKAFIHVSTSYCHCNETILEEKLYQAPHDPRKMLDIVTWMDEDVLKIMTPLILKNAPNTYAYTKCLTEQLVSGYTKKMPLVITRPSIVTAAWKEPMPGWIDNLNGPTGLMVAAGKGVVRSMHCDPTYVANIVPVDSVINSLIIIGSNVGSRPHVEEVSVYNITSNNDNTISWGEAVELSRKHFYNNPFSMVLWYPGGSIKSNYYVHLLAAFFLHLIPAYLIDILMVVTGNKPFLVRTQKRIHSGLEVLQYYTTRRWYFHNEKFGELWKNMNDADKEIFFTNQDKIDFDSYVLSYVLGARQFCVKEKPDTLPQARKLLKKLYYLDVFKNFVLGVLFAWFLWSFLGKFHWSRS